MPPLVQQVRRNPSNGQRPRISRNASGESLGSGLSLSNAEEPIKLDMRDGEMRSTSKRQENGGNGRPATILRGHQADSSQDNRSGLPAEKGFPIQIGSELFRLSGSSIMSDCQS